MVWLLLIVFLAAVVWFMKRLRDQAAEHAASGLARSPLCWFTSLLTVGLLGLAIYMAHLQRQGPTPTWLWLVVAMLVVATLLLRRALKWRYPEWRRPCEAMISVL